MVRCNPSGNVSQAQVARHLPATSRTDGRLPLRVAFALILGKAATSSGLRYLSSMSVRRY